MTGHLSARQIEEWLIGERTSEVASHLTRCPECAAELQRAAKPLALFGNAMRNWSEQIPAKPIVITAKHSAFAGFGWRASMACAALLAILAAPAYRHYAAPSRTAPPVVAVTDEVLLQQVASGISRSVPATMEPLAQLMSNDLNRE